MGLAERIRELTEPLLTAAGLECWDVEAGPGVVRVLVDRPGGVDLDTLGPLAHAVSELLDDHDVDPGGRYQLEVSSPGVERTLRTPAQFARYLGTPVAAKTAVAIDGERRFQGILLEADDEGITLGPDTAAPGRKGAPARRAVPAGEAAPAGTRRLAYRDIQKAHTVLVWGPAPKPAPAGSGGPGGRSRARAAAIPAPMKGTAS